MRKTIYYNEKTEISIKTAAKTTAGNGDTIVDRKGFNSVLAEIISGTITDGTGYEFELKHGNDSDLSDAAAVPDSDLIPTTGAEPTFAATDDDKVKRFEYIGIKRYLRIDLKTVSGSPSTGGIFTGLIRLARPFHAPV